MTSPDSTFLQPLGMKNVISTRIDSSHWLSRIFFNFSIFPWWYGIRKKWKSITTKNGIFLLRCLPFINCNMLKILFGVLVIVYLVTQHSVLKSGTTPTYNVQVQRDRQRKRERKMGCVFTRCKQFKVISMTMYKYNRVQCKGSKLNFGVSWLVSNSVFPMWHDNWCGTTRVLQLKKGSHFIHHWCWSTSISGWPFLNRKANS